VAEAAKDLLLREDETGLSVFRVADLGEADRVAKLFALTCRERPGPLDYVLLPPECFVPLHGVALLPVPDEQLHPYLSERHHEVRGLTPDLSRQLAQVLLAAGGHQVHRLKERDLVEAARQLVAQDGSLSIYLIGEWRGILFGGHPEQKSQQDH
jgi:hypothetical protein